MYFRQHKSATVCWLNDDFFVSKIKKTQKLKFANWTFQFKGKKALSVWIFKAATFSISKCSERRSGRKSGRYENCFTRVLVRQMARLACSPATFSKTSPTKIVSRWNKVSLFFGVSTFEFFYLKLLLLPDVDAAVAKVYA